MGNSAFEAIICQDWPHIWSAQLDSTNKAARARAEAHDFSPCWIATHRQTAGRGRRGKSWVGEEGNLFATAYFTFHGTVQEASKLCFVAGLAVWDAIAATGANVSDLKLKWPNDVRASKLKLSGMLLETGPAPDGAVWIAAGIGVNLKTAPKTDQQTCALSSLAPQQIPNPPAFLELLDDAFRMRLVQFARFGFDQQKHDWIERAEGLNERISVQAGSQTVIGTMTGIDDEGGLLLMGDDGTLRTISAGEVRLIG